MTVFEFVVRRLHWLARVPLAPQIFDAWLLGWTGIRHPGRLRAMEALEGAVLEIPGVRLKAHRYGGRGYALEGKELAHMHGNGLLDVRTGRAMARELVATGRAEGHHVFGDSAWISYWVRDEGDVAGGVELVRGVFGGCSSTET